MFCLRSPYGLPDRLPLHGGSAATALILVMLCVVLFLPLGLGSIRHLHDWLLYRRACQYIQQVLPAAVTGLSPTDLSIGQAKLQTLSTRNLLASHFAEHCPPDLVNRLALQRIRFTVRQLPYDPDHWMGDRQPASQPIVVIEAVLTLQNGRTLPVIQALEILIN